MFSSNDLEWYVVNAMFIDGLARDEIINIVNEDDFVDEAARIAFRAIVNIVEGGNEAVDELLLQSELTGLGVSEDDIAGILLRLFGSLPPNYVNAVEYARKLSELSRKRRLVSTLRASMVKIAEAEKLDDVLTFLQKQIASIEPQRHETVTLAEVASEIYDQIESGYKPKVVPTGFKLLDKMLGGGFRQAEMTVVAARPSMGKTALVLSWALEIAKAGHRVGLFSLEMAKEQIAIRGLAREGCIDSQAIQQYNIPDNAWQALVNALSKVSKTDIVIDDSPNSSLQHIETTARQWNRQKKLDIVFIDYLQLITVPDYRGDNRVQEVSLISRELKQLARRIDAPVVVCSQLSRACEQRNDKRPLLSDLRDSGSIEQDADVVVALYRDFVYNRETEYPAVAELIIRKQRNGPIGTVFAAFDGKTASFYDLEVKNETF